MVEIGDSIAVFDSTNGSRLWEHTGAYESSSVSGAIALSDVEAGSNTVLVRERDGAEAWHGDVLGPIVGVAIQNGVIVIEYSIGEETTAVEVRGLASGTVRGRTTPGSMAFVGSEHLDLIVLGEADTYYPTDEGLVKIAGEQLNHHEVRVFDSHICLPGTNRMYDIKRGSGAQLWTASVQANHLYKDTAKGIVYSEGRFFHAIDAASGKFLYSWAAWDRDDTFSVVSSEVDPVTAVAAEGSAVVRLSGQEAAVERAPTAIGELRSQYPQTWSRPDVSEELQMARNRAEAGNITAACQAYSRAYKSLWQPLHAQQRIEAFDNEALNSRIGALLLGGGSLKDRALRNLSEGDTDRAWQQIQRLDRLHQAGEGVTTVAIGVVLAALSAPPIYFDQNRKEPDRQTESATQRLHEAALSCGKAHTRGRAVAHLQYALELHARGEIDRTRHQADLADRAATIEAQLLAWLTASNSISGDISELERLDIVPTEPAVEDSERYVGDILQLVRTGKYAQAVAMMEAAGYLESPVDPE